MNSKPTKYYLNRSLYLPFFNTEKMRELVNYTSRKIKWLKKKLEFDAIAFSGESGSGLAYPVSYKTRVPLICVRKKGVSTHGAHIEGPEYKSKSFIVLDDMIESGATIEHIISSIERHSQKCCKCVGVVLYNDTRYGEKPDVYEFDRDIPIYNITI